MKDSTTDGLLKETLLENNPPSQEFVARVVDSFRMNFVNLSDNSASWDYSESDKPVAPPLFPHYSETAVRDVFSYHSETGERGKNVVKVNGHKQRFLALDAEWKRRFTIDESLSPINIVDIAVHYNYVANRLDKEGVELDGMIVEITDNTSITASDNSDLLINYNIGAESDIGAVFTTKALLGKDYFFSDVDEGYIDGYVESDKPSVIFIPNGNRNEFFEKLFATKNAVYSRETGCLIIVNHLDRETLFDFMDLSAVVVTTPSVTAMECLAIGMPVLLVKTSDDQTGKFVEEGLAEWYSPGVLSFLLRNKAVRRSMAENGRANIKNNITNVINIIYETWKEKYSND